LLDKLEPNEKIVRGESCSTTACLVQKVHDVTGSTWGNEYNCTVDKADANWLFSCVKRRSVQHQGHDLPPIIHSRRRVAIHNSLMKCGLIQGSHLELLDKLEPNEEKIVRGESCSTTACLVQKVYDVTGSTWGMSTTAQWIKLMPIGFSFASSAAVYSIKATTCH
uniref:TRDC protein n=1 Tax=Gongylonema pulchrum TaxID=637853 RepID=A0A183F169_9BILA